MSIGKIRLITGNLVQKNGESSLSKMRKNNVTYSVEFREEK